MKIKQHLTITRPDEFLRGNYYSCFSLFVDNNISDDWIDCGEIEIDVNVDTGKIIKIVGNEIDEQIKAMNASIVVLENRKAELLALDSPTPYPADRKVAGGIKDGNTGVVCEDTCTHIDDFPKDLGKNP